MSAKTTRDTLARQWELLKAIPAKAPGCGAGELAEAMHLAGFQVQKRQIERDLSNLSALFPLYCDNLERMIEEGEVAREQAGNLATI